ncbi:MAG: HemK2/MTQ2 family protein methyltransferase [Thermoplasmata archaeon]
MTLRRLHSSGARPDGPTARESVDDGVYPVREDSLLLLPFARVVPGTTLLEVGAGKGAASLEAARHGARTVATDLNRRALEGLRACAGTERLRLEVVRTDLARGLGRFDRILANPPYLPTRPEERDPDPGHNLALDGGTDGCAVTARLAESLADHLNAEGDALVVVSSLQSAVGLAAIDATWKRSGGRRDVVAERWLEGEQLRVWRFQRGRGPDDA